MGKILATYLVKVTLREPDDLGPDEEVRKAPTIDEMTLAVQRGIDGAQTNDGPRWYDVNATAERTDV